MNIIKIVILTGLMSVLIFRVGLAQQDIPEKHIMRIEKQLNETFGPLKPTETLITGVNVQKLMKNLLPDYDELIKKFVRFDGVSYVYRSKKVQRSIDLRIGIFKDQEAAKFIFAHVAQIPTTGPTPVKDIGDRTFVWVGRKTCTLLLQRNNALICFSWWNTKEETLKLARQIDKELESGTLFVTRGKEVKVPEVELIGLPASIKIGESVTCKLKLTNVDPAEALIGSDYNISPGVTAKPGKEPEMTYSAPKIPKEAGEKIISITVATPTNVVTTKEFKILVESQ